MAAIEGKVVIITGAGGGIGSATAHALAQRGAKVVLADRNFATACRVSEQIEGNGGTAWAMPVDVTDRSEVTNLVAAATDRPGLATRAVHRTDRTGGHRRDRTKNRR